MFYGVFGHCKEIITIFVVILCLTVPKNIVGGTGLFGVLQTLVFCSSISAKPTGNQYEKTGPQTTHKKTNTRHFIFPKNSFKFIHHLHVNCSVNKQISPVNWSKIGWNRYGINRDSLNSL